MSFIIKKLTKNKYKRNDEDYMSYYTIRAQDSYTMDFKANPNSKSLYIRIKDKLKDLGVSLT